MAADIESGAKSLWDRTNGVMEACVGPWDLDVRRIADGIAELATKHHGTDGYLTEILFQEIYLEINAITINTPARPPKQDAGKVGKNKVLVTYPETQSRAVSKRHLYIGRYAVLQNSVGTVLIGNMSKDNLSSKSRVKNKQKHCKSKKK